MNNTFVKRALSIFICLVMLLSYLPESLLIRASAAGVDTGILSSETVADPSTLNSWKDTSFNPYNLNTEHAGGLWTDKTVVKAGDAGTVFVDKDGKSLGITAGENNFLVALSALGANSVIAGQGSTPTDTIFVLDVSNSMENTDLSSMVAATNTSIHSLLTANSKNRVGVVIYSTDVDILLPLDRYTPVQKGSDTTSTADDEVAYIEMTSNYGQIRTARITQWVSSNRPSGGRPNGGGQNNGSWETTAIVKNSSGEDVNVSISASGATYIQGGLWQAYEMFNSATVTDSRVPVLVLMSDGAPTYGDRDYNNVSTSSHDVGGGGTSSITDGMAFLTQLTAAYVKEKIADKYNSTAYFYTVGLGVSESNQTVSIAEAVLDTSKTRQTPESLWSTYLGLANKTTKTMSFTATNSNITITYDSAVTSASKNYTDRYFPASDASQLNTAFRGIVNEINLKASYNVTRVDGNDVNTGGYVTFVDEIGTGMQVKNIKGILVGDTLYTGANLARALLNSEFGTAENPTDLGNNMVWALKQRLGVTDLVMDTANGTVTITATERIHDLIRQAYDAGQISYNEATGEFNNQICWFSDVNGNYLAFWDATDPNCTIPAGAAYANTSYGMLGTTTDSQTAHASDMMYVAVMVSKKVTQVDGVPTLEAKTPELVTFRVPASLLPTVTYQIDVNVADSEQITEETPATITYNAADPIRLVYEVGVHSQLTPENIQDFLREGYASKDANGNYYLYTNAWYWEPSSGVADPNNPPTKENDTGKDVLYDTSKNHITYAYFEPGEENEHYYFTEDTDLYTFDGTNYNKVTTAPVTDGSVQYYFQHKTFVSKAPTTQIGVAVDAQVQIHYEVVEDTLLKISDNYAVDATTGVYYIKEGTMHYGTIHDHDKDKVQNATGSFQYRLHQLVDIAVDGEDVASHHFEIMYLGNNGRVTYSPAQGFTLNKVMAAGATATSDFTFDVTVSGDADGRYTETRNGVSIEKDIVNNAFALTLAAGQSVTVTGLDVGETYTVTEREMDGYKLGGIVVSAGSVSGATATGTVVENVLHSITYTNDLQGYGSLLVTKSVTYNKNSQPQSDPHTFSVTVTFPGLSGKQVYVDNVLTTLDSQGKTVLTLTAGGQKLITGIPEGADYTVTEDATALTPGYSVVSGTFNGTIVADQIAVAGVENAYTPEDVVIGNTDPIITLQVNKDLIVSLGAPSYLPDGYDFLFNLQRYNEDTGKWVPLPNSETIRISNPIDPSHSWYDPAEDNQGTASLSLSGITFDSVGSHYFRVKEHIPEDLKVGWTYDQTHHDFKVVVTDTDLDGELEISSVEKVDDTVTVTPTDSNSDNVTDVWGVSTGFTNSYVVNSTKLTIGAKKTLTGATLQEGQFGFALYKTGSDYNTSGITPITAKNGANGDIVFVTETYSFANGTQNYYYVMKELSADGNGITTDKTVWEIQVTVSGIGTAAEVTAIQYRKSGETTWTIGTPQNNIFSAITFQNTYTAAPVTLELSGNKTLTNLTPGVAAEEQDMTSSIQAGDFRFNLTKVSGVDSNTTIKVKNDQGAVQNYESIGSAVQAGGNIVFTGANSLYFDAVGTYVFKVTEEQGSKAGITYDTSEYLVTVVVADNGLGALEVTSVTYTRSGVRMDAIAFNNTYTASPVTGLNIHAKKVLNVPATFDRPLVVNEFRATLTHPDGTQETVYNDANGIFTFASLSFNAVGTYNYSISEVIPLHAVNNKLSGVIYDAVSKNFTIVVTDDGNGNLVAKLNGTEELTSSNNLLAATITNTYEAAPASIHLLAHKDLDGRNLRAEEFSFLIEALTAGAPMPTASIVKNNEEGDVDFGMISFPSVGVYQYKITELKLDENGEPLTADPVTGEYIYKGVTYSAKEYTVTVQVDDLRNGNLIAHVSAVDENGDAQPGGVIFTNIFTPKDTALTIQVEKELVNNTIEIMGVDGFKFLLVGEDGEQILTSNANGLAELTLNFTPEDLGKRFTYTLSEVAGDIQYMVYDDTVYTIAITVTQADDGELELVIEREGTGAFKFVNVYNGEPDNPPKTGDVNLGLPAALAISSCACLFVLILCKKRMTKEQEA